MSSIDDFSEKELHAIMKFFLCALSIPVRRQAISSMGLRLSVGTAVGGSDYFLLHEVLNELAIPYRNKSFLRKFRNLSEESMSIILDHRFDEECSMDGFSFQEIREFKRNFFFITKKRKIMIDARAIVVLCALSPTKVSWRFRERAFDIIKDFMTIADPFEMTGMQN